MKLQLAAMYLAAILLAGVGMEYWAASGIIQKVPKCSPDKNLCIIVRILRQTGRVSV